MDRTEVDRLLGDLVRGSEAERRSALKALVEACEIRAIPRLERMARTDEFHEFRLLARSALQTFSTHGAGPSLDDLDPDRRIAALEAIALRQDRGAIDEVLNRSSVELDPRVLGVLVTVIGILGDRKHDAVLERCLGFADPQVRANTIEALDTIGSASSYLKFVRFALDRDPRVRVAATRALVHVGRERLIRLLIVVARFDHPADIEGALFLLDALKTPRALGTFQKFLTHESPAIRHRARSGLVGLASDPALARTASPGEVRAILENTTLTEISADAGVLQAGEPAWLAPGRRGALDDPDPRVRLECVLSLETGAGGDAIRGVKRRLKIEGDVRVRATLLRVLGLQGNRGHLSLVQEFLEDPHARVRASAVEAYAHLATARERLELLRFLDDPSRRVVANTILALWRQGRQSVRERLTRLATSADRLDRLAAIHAIGLIGIEAGNLLNPMVDDPDPDVAEQAVCCQRVLGLRSARIVVG